MKKTYVFWFLVVCWMALLFVLSGQSVEESSSVSGRVIEAVAIVIKPSFSQLDVVERSTYIDGLQGIVRNLAHYLSYLVLGTLISLAMQTHSLRLRNQILWSLAIGVAYAVSDEIHQHFVPGRSMQLSDIITDSIGVLTGVLIVNYKALRHCALADSPDQ